jgi:hypothetical protein
MVNCPPEIQTIPGGDCETTSFVLFGESLQELTRTIRNSKIEKLRIISVSQIVNILIY